MIQGLISGVTSMAKRVLDSVMSVVGGAVNAVKSFLGIHSPSKLFMGLGINTILGLVKGIQSERKSLTNEMTSMADEMSKFYSQVGAAAELDASLNLQRNATGTMGVESLSLEAQLAALSGQLQEIANKDTVNIEKLEVNNPEPEPTSESLPNAIRSASYVGVG
jgi:phage-related protein